MTSTLEPGPVERQGSATNVKLTKVAVQSPPSPALPGNANSAALFSPYHANQISTYQGMPPWSSAKRH